MTQIFYATLYGSTKQYAEALANRLGVEAKEINQESASLIDEGPIIVFSPVHGSFIRGAKFLNELGPEVVEKHKVCLAPVGIALDHVLEEMDPAADLLGDLAAHVKRVYLPGRLNYSELAPDHHDIMRTRIEKMKAKDARSDNEEMMVDTYDTDVDRVDLDRLDEIVEWVQS